MRKTLILVSLLVGFFCFFGDVNIVSASEVSIITSASLNALNPTILDFEDTSIVPATGYWDKYGVKITSDKGEASYMNDFNRNGDKTYSGQYSLSNIETWPITSANDPLKISFFEAKKAVGFYLGNAENGVINAKVYVYGSHSDLIGTLDVRIQQNAVLTFVGIESTEAIFEVDIDYGNTLASEDMDYLMMVPFTSSGSQTDSVTDDSGAPRKESDMLPANDETKTTEPVRKTTQDSSDVKVEPTEVGKVQMTCGNSSGGDGLYSLCKGDTVKHDAGISVYNRAYDGEVIKLMATGLENSYFRIGIGQTVTQKSTAGDTFSFTYKEKSANFGAFVKISHESAKKIESAPADTKQENSSETLSGSLPITGKDCVSLKNGGKRLVAFGNSKVYYGYKGYKHWFPNEEIYMSWFENFAGIQVITQAELDQYKDGLSICKNTGKNKVTEGEETTEDKKVLPAFNETIRRTPNTNASEAVGMSCGNSEGGDGLYSACKGDTINHSSGVKILNRAYDPNLVKFMLTGASQDYVRASLGGSVEVKTADGKYTLKLTYVKKDATYGAFVQVETITSDVATSTSVEEETDRTETVLPAYDETKTTSQGVNVSFNVSVNDYPDHKNYDKNQNLSSAFVNMYKVELQKDGFFHVISTDTQPVDANRKIVSFSVAPGDMVYFEGFKTSRGAGSGQISKEAIGWSAPPYKNFSANGRSTDKLCQTNFNDTDHYLSCSDNLSTPYQDTSAN